MSFQKKVETEMRVSIYQFTKYDIISDSEIKSKRWGTQNAIDRIGGTIIMASKSLVDKSVFLNSGIEGMTAIGFVPPH